MQPVSGKWAPALTTDHGRTVKVNVLYNGSIVAEDVAFSEGSVSVDRGSEVRRTLSLTIPDPADFPHSETDTYGVYGQRIYVEGGLRYLDGSTESVPLGTFVITSVSGDIHTGPLTVQAAGLEVLLKTEFETATSTSGYVSAAAFISYHITDTVPGASFVNLSTGGSAAVATKTWDSGTEKWSALKEVATAAGAELFVNAAGTYVLADPPDIATATPVWDVLAGEGGVMVSAEMELNRDGVFNRVVASGENAEDNTAPVSAEAKITASTDPLRYGGPFGKQTKSYSSSLITTAAKALAAANTLLAKYRAPNRTVSLSTVPNLALDAGDCIRVRYLDDVMPPELHLVQSFAIPLSVGGGAGFAIATVSGKDDPT
ncbi:DUF5047 domain-containing protein [Streptomyces avermitilis]|uniref:DUF5047 domain-containing protein n=1 Tax=Streptomyces avermitilis TaxID=33903 RepID=UPI003821DCCD